MIFNILGCTGFMHGYTAPLSMNQMLFVEKNKDNFGYKRINYMIGFHREGIKNFISEKGYPNYIYEFKENGRYCATLFYTNENKAYIFKEQNWQPQSFVMVQSREINDDEKRRFGVKY